jgi:uncharacterized DUF497 family protein
MDYNVSTDWWCSLRFEWDEAKSRRNRVKHRISFETAMSVFDDPNLLSLFDRIADGEERWQSLGLIDGVIVALVAHTYREEEGDEAIRIISARKATPRERTWYEKGGQE